MKSNKLINELTNLVTHNVISNEVASNITAYYKSKDLEQPNRLFTVFGVLGSTLVGLGIILILAHNWDNFSRFTKTITAFLPLVIGQSITGYAILKKKSQAWRESSGVFLFFSIGAAIALVSQIYNIPGDLSSFLLTWTVLSLPLVYVLNSKALTVLIIVFASYYACEFGYGYFNTNKTPWLYLVLILGTIPYYIKALKNESKSNATAVLSWLYALSLIVVFGTFIKDNWSLGFLMYALVFGVFYNLGKLPVFNNQQLRRNSFVLLGSLGMVILLLILTFNFVWKEMNGDALTLQSQEFVIVLILFGLALSLLIYTKRFVENVKFNLFQFAFLVFAVIFFAGFNNPSFGTIFTNILIIALGIFAVKIGADTFRFSVLNYGLLIITAVITCRFFDTILDFYLRGALFVAAGIGFFLTNYIMLKRKTKK